MVLAAIGIAAAVALLLPTSVAPPTRLLIALASAQVGQNEELFGRAGETRGRTELATRRKGKRTRTAKNRGRLVDSLISVGALVIYAMPVFWLGLMLIVFFSITLGALPSGGMTDVRAAPAGLAYVADVVRHALLPVLTMGLFYVAIYTRLMRASMLEVYALDFITTARAKGVPERRIAWSHAARNALLPVVTLAGLQFGHLLGGSVLVETVFGWPGLGRLVFDSLLQRDLNLLLGLLFVSSAVVVLANLAADLTYGLLDPRIVHR